MRSSRWNCSSVVQLTLDAAGAKHVSQSGPQRHRDTSASRLWTRLRELQDLADRRGDRLPARFLGLELLAAAGGDLVDARPASGVGRRPARLDPAAPLRADGAPDRAILPRRGASRRTCSRSASRCRSRAAGPRRASSFSTSSGSDPCSASWRAMPSNLTQISYYRKDTDVHARRDDSAAPRRLAPTSPTTSVAVPWLTGDSACGKARRQRWWRGAAIERFAKVASCEARNEEDLLFFS